MSAVTRILSAIKAGDAHAAEQLLALVYEELRKLAAVRFGNEKPGQTLDATDLVHEADLRFVDVDQVQRWNGRGHLFFAAAEAMRRILVENARRKRSEKRGGGLHRMNLDDADAVAAAPPDDLLVLNEAFERLTGQDATAGQLVQLHCHAGLTIERAAKALGLSRTSAYRLWTLARAWLHSQLAGDPEAEFWLFHFLGFQAGVFRTVGC